MRKDSSLKEYHKMSSAEQKQKRQRKDNKGGNKRTVIQDTSRLSSKLLLASSLF